jgi:hypothetical protein
MSSAATASASAPKYQPSTSHDINQLQQQQLPKPLQDLAAATSPDALLQLDPITVTEALLAAQATFERSSATLESSIPLIQMLEERQAKLNKTMHME